MLKSLTLVILFFSCFQLYAQQTYTGEYSFNGIKGIAVYDYRLQSDGNHLKNGAFQFSRKFMDALGTNILLKTEVKGRYENDKKTGVWNYLEEEHRVEIQDVENFKIAANLNSHQVQLKSEYGSGLPDGSWTFGSFEFSNGKLAPKEQAEKISFRKGEIVGEFQYKEYKDDKTFFINGKVNNDGLMDGEWTLVYEQGEHLISEIRKYEKGFLLGLVKRDLKNGEVLSEKVFYKTIAKLKEATTKKNLNFRTADEKFDILFNDGFLSYFDEYTIQKNGNLFISKFLQNILRYDAQYINTKGDLIKFPISTKRFVYEIPKTQHQYLVSIPENFRASKQITNNYLQNSALRLHQKESKSLTEAYAFFQFSSQKLKHFEEIIVLFENQNIQYVDLDYWIESEISGLSPKDIFQFNFEDEFHQKSIEYPTIQNSGDFFKGLKAYLDTFKEEIVKYQEIVDQELKLISQNDQLLKLQNQILQEKEFLDELYLMNDNRSDKEIDLFKAIHQNVIEETYKALADKYIPTKNNVLKRSIAENILDVFSEAKNQYEFLNNIYSVKKELDSLYTEEVFNPFTYTRYNQRVKERLYVSGVERLFEHYVNAIKIEKDIHQFNFWKEKLEKLTQRLATLRNEETRSLERKLVRVENVSKIEALLGL